MRKQVVEASVERFALAASFTAAGSVLSRKRVGEQPRPLLQDSRCCRRVFRRGPCVLESRRIIVADARPPLPFGASQPHHSGVRLGKCHASRKVKVCDWRGAIVALCSTTPTALRPPAPRPARRPAEKASQKSIGEFHQRPCGQPRQCCTCTPGCTSAARATVPRIGSLSGSAGLRHRQTSKSRVRLIRIPPRIGIARRPRFDRILERPGDAHLRACALRIRYAIAQNRDRQAGVIRLMRNEGREGFQLHLHRHRSIFKGDMRQRIGASERRRIQPAQPGRIVRSQAILSLVRRKDARFQHACDRLCIARLRPDRRKRIRRRVALVRTVEDLPIAQLPAATQATLPAATPPSGKAIIFSLRPVKTRGKAASLAAVAGPTGDSALYGLAERGPPSYLGGGADGARSRFRNVRRGSGSCAAIGVPLSAQI